MADWGAVIIDHEPEVTGQFRSRRFVEVLARSIFITITMESLPLDADSIGVPGGRVSKPRNAWLTPMSSDHCEQLSNRESDGSWIQ